MYQLRAGKINQMRCSAAVAASLTDNLKGRWVLSDITVRHKAECEAGGGDSLEQST